MIQQVKSKRFLPIALILLLAVVGPVGEALALPFGTGFDPNLATLGTTINGTSGSGYTSVVDEFIFDPDGPYVGSLDGGLDPTVISATGNILQIGSASDPYGFPVDPIFPEVNNTSSYQIPGLEYDGSPTLGDVWTGTDGGVLTTSLTLSAGEYFSFDWMFLSFENMLSDFSLFVTSAGTTTQNILSTSEMIVPAAPSDPLYFPEIGTSGPWQTYTFAPATDFVGDITWVGSNGDYICPWYDSPPYCGSDTSFPSVLLVSNLQYTPVLTKIVTSVPEPGTLVMMVIGLGGLGLTRRRRSQG